MIHYQLQCDHDHGFDGWFRDSAGFDAQAARGLVECPQCGSVKVRRALMTPSVARSREVAPIVAEAPAPAAPPVAVGGERIPDHIRAMLQRLRAEVEKNCDYVGNEFAGEARRIHNGEKEARAIYGEATPEEAEALADDGIEIGQIPWLPRADG